jgi:D-sedoheptulose 7-phosphate isomerase
MGSNDGLHERMTSLLKRSAEVKLRVAESCGREILEASKAISDCFRDGGKLLLCGNGGSAADCQHMASEFVGRLTPALDRPGLPAIALTTDSSFLTAFANDCGYEGVFARQVQALGKQEDVFIGISTSGSSPNVIRAAEQANAMGMVTIGLMGEGGPLAGVCDLAIGVQDGSTQHVQEAHLAIEHVICELVELQLFGSQ